MKMIMPYLAAIAAMAAVFLGIAFFIDTLSQEGSCGTARIEESLWDLPTTPGAYVRVDPDTEVEYIIVITNGGRTSICKREK